MSEVTFSIIVAAAENDVIGVDNGLPWRLPEDLKRFKKLTMGHPVIMGRNTWESLPEAFRPLPGRDNIVLSHQKDFQLSGDALLYNDSAQALIKAKSICDRDKTNEVFIIGGEAIYRLALPIVRRIYLTRIHSPVDGDAFFPVLNQDQWQELERIRYNSDDKAIPSFSFITLERL